MPSHIREALLRSLPSFAKSKVFENAVSLYLVQGLQYLIPLISFPWMVRALGGDGYGIFALSGACGAYVQAICDYGFSLSATRNVSQHKLDRDYLSRTFASIFLAKLGLGVASLAVCLPLFLLIPKFRVNFTVLILSCLSSFFASHFPSWLFQGMERMRQMAFLSAFSKVMQLILLVALIRTPSDLLKSLLIFCLTNIVTTTAAWIFAWHTFRLRLVIPHFQDIRRLLSEGFEIFISQIGVVIFANANTIVLGIVAPARIVGEYSIAEKIVRVGINLGGPIGTALFPHIAAMIVDSKEKAFIFLKKCILIGGLFFLLISFGLILFSGFAVQIISGAEKPLVTHVIWILSPLPLSVFIDNILGAQILLNLGFKRTFMAATISAGFISLALLVLLVPRFSAYGAATALLVSEFWVLIFFGIHVHWKTDFFESRH